MGLHSPGSDTETAKDAGALKLCESRVRIH